MPRLQKAQQTQSGFIQLLMIPAVILIALVVGYFIFITSNIQNTIQTVNKQTNSLKSSEISWQFDMEKGVYRASSTPPDCQKPLKFPSPVNINLATSILYPGQIRGTDYKPHGGFRFDDRNTNDIQLKAIMDGYIYKASRYEVNGEVQILVFYINDCGIMVMNDHILTPSPRLKEVFDKIPVGKNGDSRTTNIEPRVYLKKGELLATEIGFKKNKNIFVDFGLYNLRKTNNINYDSAFRAKHPNINEYGTHALCWFDYLSPEDKSIVKSLPPADSINGSTSDYCK